MSSRSAIFMLFYSCFIVHTLSKNGTNSEDLPVVLILVETEIHDHVHRSYDSVEHRVVWAAFTEINSTLVRTRLAVLQNVWLPEDDGEAKEKLLENKLISKLRRPKAVLAIVPCRNIDKYTRLFHQTDVVAVFIHFCPCFCKSTISTVKHIQVGNVEAHRRHPCLVSSLLDWLTKTLREENQTKLIEQSDDSCPHVEDGCNYMGSTSIDSNLCQDFNSNYPYFLQKKQLLIVTIERPPFMIFERDKITGERTGSRGILPEVLNVFKQAYGFSYRLLEPYDGQWGKELDNGTWNGMIGMVMRQEVDVAASSITMTDEREAVIDFTIPFFQESSTILLPRMSQQSDIFSFVAPLEWEVWLWMFFSLFLVSMLIYAVNRQVNHVTIPYPQNQIELFSQWFRPLWYNIGAILQQGGFIPLLHSSRILLMAWLLVVLVVMNLYKGTLIAFLTIPKTYKFADSLEELASQNMIKWTFLRNTAYEALFSKNSDSEVMRKIGKPFEENPEEFVSTSKEGVERVLSGQYAFIKEKSYLEASIEEDFHLSGQCRFSLAKEEFYPVGYGLALQTNSPYLEPFNLLMQRMIQAGLLVKWHKDYFDINNDCASLSEPKLGEHSLTITDLKGSFALLGIGLCLSVSAFVMEVFYHWIRKKEGLG